MSEKKLIHQPGKMLFVASFIVLTALVLFNTVLALELLKLSRNDNQMPNIIVKAIENLNQPIVIEPLSGRAYIPSAKLVLPPNNDLAEVVYRHSPGETGFTEGVTLSTVSDIGQASAAVLGSPDHNAVFAGIPKLQACARAVHVKFGTESLDTTIKPAGTKTLSNKKVVHFYTEPLCPNPELLEYAKQINSY